jgi:cyclic pyranopterin phosphate synthase
LSADGKLYTCLFASEGFDLRAPLRDGASDDELYKLLVDRWSRRDDRYSELRWRQRAEEDAETKIEMFQIGG